MVEPVTLPVVEDADDRPIDLARLAAGAPMLLVLYLGGWSVQCVRGLRTLEAARHDLLQSGWRFAGLSAESVGQLGRTRGTAGTSVLLGHDHAARFSARHGLSVEADTGFRTILRAAGVRLADWNGENSHHLTRPATLLVDAFGRCEVHAPATDGRDDIDRALSLALLRPRTNHHA